MTRVFAGAAMASILAIATPSALAQPGAEPPPEDFPGADEPPPTPTPAPVLSPTRAPRYAVIMTAEERELVLRGEISTGRYIAGGILSYAAGFGIGHAVQGRWSETGWIFTVGQAAASAVFVYGFAECIDDGGNDCTLLLGGLLGLAGLRVWEIVDAWVAPHLHNRRVRRVRAKYRLDSGALPYRAKLHLGPVKGGGMTGGFSLRF